MLPYYLLVAVPTVFGLTITVVDLCRGRRRDLSLRVFMALFFLGYILLLACRHTYIGLDTANYGRHFAKVAGMEWGDILHYRDSDWAYFFLCKLIAMCGGDFRVLLVVVAVLTAVPVGILYAERSKSPLLSVSLYLILPVFMLGFSGLRQAVAVALGAMAYRAVVARRWGWAVFWIISAVLFHRSAFVLIMLIPLRFFRLRAGHLPILAALYSGVYVMKEPVFGFLLSLLGEASADRYGTIRQTGGTTMILLFALILVMAFLLPVESELDEETCYMRNLLALALFIQLFSSISTLSMRLNYYFILYIPLLLSRILTARARVEKLLTWGARGGMTAFFLTYYFTQTTVTDSLRIYPYIHFWI